MAKMTFDIPDKDINRVINALCFIGNYNEKTAELIPRPTKEEYAKTVIIDFVKRAMNERESRDQVEAVKTTVKTDIDTVAIS